MEKINSDIRELPIEWDQVTRMCINFAKGIKESGVQFDSIVGISRGGLIPAIIVSHLLGIKDVVPVTVNTYNADGIKYSEPEIPQETIDQLRQLENVLLVDDIIDSGDTIHYILSFLPEDTLTFSLVGSERFMQARDGIGEGVIGKQVDDKTWVVFPWELSC